MCGITTIILPDQDVCGNGGKNKKFLFRISKKEMESPFSIAVTWNPN
jgi:hypothetical protein